MTMPRFKSSDELLTAYYKSKGEAEPATQAYAWLRAAALRNFKVGGESMDYAESILDRAILDVEDVTQNFLGLDLFLDDLSAFDTKAGAEVFGVAEPTSGTIKIDFRAVDYKPLYRSTVMHEVAHVMLHPGRRSRVKCYSPRSPKRPNEERQADRFMAASLLPEPILYLAIFLAERFFGIEHTAAFVSANTARGRFQWRDYYFPFFLNRLCLSRELVAVRMVQRGTFNQSTFEHHRTYPIPNRWRQPAPLTLGKIATEAFESLHNSRVTSRRPH